MIEIADFTKSYGKKQVHRGVSFHVKKGECLGLIGGSGTGKSVILRTLIGLEKPDQGDVKIDGQSIVGLDDHQLVEVRKRVAYVFQGGALFDSMTVFDNLAYPLREHTQLSEGEIKKRIQKTLDEFGLGGNENVMPSNLSGGMQKRVGLARAIILNPEIILYDEPTAGLDPFNTRRIQDMIAKLKDHGTTSILVTHDMPVALAVCDRLVLLLQGKIAAEMTPDDFYKSEGHLMKKFIQGEAI